MVDIQSKEVIDKISDELKIQPALDIPRGLGKDIQLVYGINRENTVNIMRCVSSAISGTTAIFITPTDRDFFLTYAAASFAADVVNDTTSFDFNFTVAGNAETCIQVAKTTLLAADRDFTHNFSTPIKLERGTAINITGVFTVGTLVKNGTIFGFTTDPQ